METLRVGSTGPLVELLQSALRKAGYTNINADGVFGEQTRAAVMVLQRSSGLLADGIVGISTWRALLPYIHGYDIYTINPGDTLFAISRRYSTSIERILVSNPGIDAYNLLIGQKIIVPFGDVVPTDISYTHNVLTMNIQALREIYPFLRVGTIGNSELCQKIWYIRIGTGSKEVFYNASFHANEWITSPLLMKFIENFSRAYAEDTNIYGYSAREIYRNVSIYIVPMVNPDGADLVTGSIKPGTAIYEHAERIASGFPDIPFPSGWKANIYGIDPNQQFPAQWEKAREIKYAQGFDRPAPRDYVGPYPLSAAEPYSIYRFTLEHNFRLTLSYHTQGRVIFWRFGDYIPPYSYEIGRRLADTSGYLLEERPAYPSYAGYKDWFIQEYNRPGYTVEVGLGVNPLPVSQFDTIYSENESVLVLAAILAP